MCQRGLPYTNIPEYTEYFRVYTNLGELGWTNLGVAFQWVVLRSLLASKMESEVLRRFYSDIQHSITNPIGVASLLHQEDVVLLDEVSPTNKVSPVEKTASIMRHVEAAIRVDLKSFWVFLSVLNQFTPSRHLTERMRQAVDLHTSGSY